MKEQFRTILDDLINNSGTIDKHIDGRSLLSYLEIKNVIDYHQLVELDRLGPNCIRHLVSNVLKCRDDSAMPHFLGSLKDAKYDDAYNWLKKRLEKCPADESEPNHQRMDHTNITNEKKIDFDLRDPDAQFIGRELQLSQLHQMMCSNNRTEMKTIAITEKSAAVAGLGGTGKTQLALRYAQLYGQEYNSNIAWINAETEITFRDSFRRLSQKLEIRSTNVDGKEKELKDIVADVYDYFSNRKILFIFDNADKPIERELYPSIRHKVHILITSRYQEWGDIKVFPLGNFTLEEAVQFIKNALNIEDKDLQHETNLHVNQLADSLHFFPLALRQATAYIKETNEAQNIIGSSFAIEDYLKLYKQKKEELLSYPFFNDVGTTNSQTTFTTWTITMIKIGETINPNPLLLNKAVGKLALNILECISYFSSEKIDPKIFLENNNEKEIGFAIKLLKQYSIVNVENGMLSVHPLIQEVTRINLKRDNSEEKTFTTVGKLVEAYFQSLPQEHNYIQIKQVLVHSERLLGEIKIWLENNPLQRKRVEHKNIRELLLLMDPKYYIIGDYRQYKVVLEQLLAIETGAYGVENYKIARTLGNLGTAHVNLGDPEKGKTLYERALAIQEKHYGPDHFVVAATLVNLGIAYGKLSDPVKGKTLYERALAIQKKHYGPDHFVVAATLVNLGNAYFNLDYLEKGKTLYEIVLGIQEKHYGPDHFEVAATLVNLSIAYAKLSDPEKGKTLLERALAIREKHYGPDHFVVAATLVHLGNAYFNLRDPKTGKTLYKRALTIQEKHYGPDHFEVAATLINLGIAYGNLIDREKGKTLLERALSIQEKYYGPDHFVVAATLVHFGNAYLNSNDPEKGKTLLERALAIREKHYGSDHFVVAATLVHLGDAYFNLRDPKTGKTLYERALAIQEKHYGPDHFKFAAMLVNLSNVYHDLGDLEKGKILYERALAIQEKHYGHDHFEVAVMLVHLSNVYCNLGDLEKGKTLYERALAIQEKHYGPDHFKVAAMLVNLSNVYHDLGDLEKGKTLYERALAIQEKHYGPDHFKVAAMLVNLSNVYHNLGDLEKGKILYERALAIQEKHYGPDHLKVAWTLTNLGNVYNNLGDPVKGKTLLDRASAIQEKHYGPDQLKVALTLSFSP